MGTTTFATAKAAGHIPYCYKCHHCGAQNVQVDRIVLSKTTQTYGRVPFGRQARAQRDAAIRQSAQDAADDALTNKLFDYENGYNLYHNYYRRPLTATCQHCGRKQIWSDIKDFPRMGLMYLLAVVLMYFAINLDSLIYRSIASALCFLPALIAVLFPGIAAIRAQAAVDKLAIQYLPAIISRTAAAEMAAANANSVPPLPAPRPELNPLATAGNLALDVLRRACFMLAIALFLSGNIYGTVNYRFVEYVPFEADTPVGEHVSLLVSDCEVISMVTDNWSLSNPILYRAASPSGDVVGIYCTRSKMPDGMLYGSNLGSNVIYGQTAYLTADEAASVGLPEDCPVIRMVAKKLTDAPDYSDTSPSPGVIAQFAAAILFAAWLLLQIRHLIGKKKGGY